MYGNATDMEIRSKPIRRLNLVSILASTFANLLCHLLFVVV